MPRLNGLTRSCCASLWIVAALSLAALTAHADTATFAIEPQDLSGALKAFAVQSHREIFFAPELARADYLTFTSSSTVRFFLASAQPGADTRIASIGPVTSATLHEHGLTPHVEATRHDIDGLLDAIVADRREQTAGR